MDEIVCDFEQVRAAGDALVKSAENYDSAISSFSTSIEGDLSEWKGATKTELKSQVDSQVQTSSQVAEQVRNLGNYIVECVNKIEETDKNIASECKI